MCQTITYGDRLWRFVIEYYGTCGLSDSLSVDGLGLHLLRERATLTAVIKPSWKGRA